MAAVSDIPNLNVNKQWTNQWLTGVTKLFKLFVTEKILGNTKKMYGTFLHINRYDHTLKRIFQNSTGQDAMRFNEASAFVLQ